MVSRGVNKMKTKFRNMAWYSQILIVLLIIILSVICIPIIIFTILAIITFGTMLLGMLFALLALL